jgi:hypothetical protein
MACGWVITVNTARSAFGRLDQPTVLQTMPAEPDPSAWPANTPPRMSACQVSSREYPARPLSKPGIPTYRSFHSLVLLGLASALALNATPESKQRQAEQHGDQVVLADWDVVSTGPREIDLIPTLQASRFGLPEHERDAFIAAYGHDIRGRSGYPVLRDIRELSTISALLRDAHLDPAAHDQLQVRLRSIRTGDTRQWTTF